MSAMIDRELLELAAKAAGMTVGKRAFEWDNECVCFFRHEPDQGGISGPWNPLTDDGDALRLAVKLGTQVTPPSKTYPHAFAMDALKQRGAVREDNVSDPLAATRRAIVRAAAEIGKAMP